MTLPRLVAVTPAGRRHYLELLAHHLLAQEGLDEWQLWDNCRQPADRAYLTELAARDPRIRIVTVDRPDGTNRTVNRFYAHCQEPQTFYVKLDDDVVWLEPGVLARMRADAVQTRGQALWWSPLVINNAVCSWLIQHHGRLPLPEPLSCQAACGTGWRDPDFAVRLHQGVLPMLRTGELAPLRVGIHPVSLSRFSINCLGFFGSDVVAQGAQFCPPDVDDEEWLSAVLPSKLGRGGRVLGDSLVAHFSFYTQEQVLLHSRVLDAYYELAGLPVPVYPKRPFTWRQRWKRWRQQRRATA